MILDALRRDENRRESCEAPADLSNCLLADGIRQASGGIIIAISLLLNSTETTDPLRVQVQAAST
jgi:hypothetical protein